MPTRRVKAPGRQVPLGAARSRIQETSWSTPNAHVGLYWDTRKFLHTVAAVNEAAFARAEKYALKDWNDNEWLPAHHPYMTGNKESIKANVVIQAEASDDGLHVRLIVGSTSEHAGYEEFGTSRQPAHHPIRNVVDRTTPQITRFMREEARKRGL